MDRRIAAVWTSDVSRAVQTAEIAAGVLGVGVTACKSLREVFIGDLLGQGFDVRRIREVSDRWHAGDLDARYPGGESGHEVVARHRQQLEAITDQHPGETVLVVGHQTALELVVPALTGRTDPSWPGTSELENCVDLVRQGRGWALGAPSPGPVGAQPLNRSPSPPPDEEPLPDDAATNS